MSRQWSAFRKIGKLVPPVIVSVVAKLGSDKQVSRIALSLVLHRMFRIGQHVPCLPETPHFIRETQRDSDVCIHEWKATSNQNIIFAEMLGHFFGRMKGIHHYKVGVRIDRLKRTSHSLIKEFLTVVHITSNKIVHTADVVQRCDSGLSNNRVNIVLTSELPNPLNRMRRRHCIT